MKKYYVYIMTNGSGTLYTGITNDLLRRVWEHKEGENPGFTQKYKTKRLVYYEETNDVRNAIEREKQIKGRVRKKKVELVESVNSNWEDLSREWLENKKTPENPKT